MSATEIPTIPLHLRPWLTRSEAAIIANVHPQTILAAIRAGQLIERKGIGPASGRIARPDLDAWIRGDTDDADT